MLASGKTNSGDEVFMEVDARSNLLKLSKDKSHLSNIYGELVGISKISLDTFKELCEWAERNMSKSKKMHYEEALSMICDTHQIYVEKIKNLIWTEIDTLDHYRRALNHIYPQLINKEKNK